MKPSFKISSKEKATRAGVIKTPHGTIHTPAFFPVGTKGTVKSLTPAQLKEIGVEAVLANTYHLHLQPGETVVKSLGDLSSFMDWQGPTMTDSGGFQVFSLGIGLEKPGVKFLKDEDDALRSPSKISSDPDFAFRPSSILKAPRASIASSKDFAGSPRPRLNRITEEGVCFQSHIDGSRQFLSPETSIEIQEKIGADLIVGFDDLESPTYDFDQTRKSLELTNRWLLRSKQAQKRKDQLLYGVTHGGRFEDLRKESAQFVDQNFPAIALGGAHKNKKNLYEVIDWTVQNVSEGKPRHLLGIGEIDDIFEAVDRGIDTFDCVIPTRLGRMGHVFVSPPEGSVRNRFRYDITKLKFANDKKSIDPRCSCYVCSSFSRAYVNHLFRAHELLAYTLASYHNVYFLTNLMREIRSSILDQSFKKLKSRWV